MRFKQTLKSLYIKIKQQPLWITIPSVAVFLLIIIYLVSYLPERTVEFSYSEKNTCTSHITFLPGLNRFKGDTDKYSVKNENILKIGNFELLSLKTCFSAKKSPTVGDSRISISFLGSILFNKTFKLVVSKPPVARLGAVGKPVPTLKPLAFTLSSADYVFNYQLKVDNKTASCPAKDSEIYCNIASLNLVQDKNYKIELVRTFDGKKVATLVNEDIKTLKATNVASSSLSEGQVIYDKPKTFTFDFDKDVAKGKIALYKIEADKRTPIVTEANIDGKQAIIKIKEDLARDTAYEFTIDQLEAKDGSTLPGPYKLSFTASGGPSVSNINIGTSAVDANAKVVVTFDQAISPGQDLSKFASFTGGSASISRTDNQIIFQLNTLPVCGEFSIKINEGLISKYDIVSKKGWSYSSRINCRRATSVVGYSVKGRPIIAYYYGSGSTTVLFTGGIHGSERSGSYIMRDWVSHLDSYAYNIPADRQVVVVPDTNPDGLASLSRYNANNVNIDRNFPSVNWKSDIDTSIGIVVGGGGASPLSEPETVALANLTTSLRPRLEVSFHAQGSLIGANQVGDSVSIGNLYGSSVGYRSMIGQAEEIMGYSITGEYEDWAGEQSIAAILIELPSASGRYFNTHQSVLWKMVNI